MQSFDGEHNMSAYERELREKIENMSTFEKELRRGVEKEVAERIIRLSQEPIEKFAYCFPLLSLKELKELEAEINNSR